MGPAAPPASRLAANTFDLLSTATLGAVLPSVRTLAEGQNRAARIVVVPQQAPQVTLGSNRVTRDGNGTYAVDDALLTINWKGFDIHLYAWVMERYTRLFTLRGDLVLPVALVPDGQGNLIPVLGDLERALQNVRLIESRILREDHERLLEADPHPAGLRPAAARWARSASRSRCPSSTGWSSRSAPRISPVSTMER